jgi:hypothetical protein
MISCRVPADTGNLVACRTGHPLVLRAALDGEEGEHEERESDSERYHTT